MDNNSFVYSMWQWYEFKFEATLVFNNVNNVNADQLMFSMENGKCSESWHYFLNNIQLTYSNLDRAVENVNHQRLLINI